MLFQLPQQRALVTEEAEHSKQKTSNDNIEGNDILKV